jgi:hypothetical protein
MFSRGKPNVSDLNGWPISKQATSGGGHPGVAVSHSLNGNSEFELFKF